jgi:hypothetical protein
VSRLTQDAQAHRPSASPGPSGHEGAAGRRSAHPPPQSWGGDEPGISPG